MSAGDVVSYLLKELQGAGIPIADLKAKIDAFIAAEKAKLPPELQASFTLSTDQAYAIVSQYVGPDKLAEILNSLVGPLVNFLVAHEGPFDNEPLGLA